MWRKRRDGAGEIGLVRINLQQLIKWTVYVLLLINWALYIQEDWQNAQHTLRSGGSLLDWTIAFGTSLDEAAWVNGAVIRVDGGEHISGISE